MSPVPKTDINVNSAISWTSRLKEEIGEIQPLISKVDAIWEAGPVAGTIEDAYAAKLRDIDEKWIKVLDDTWKGIDAIVQAIKKIAERIEEYRKKILGF